MKPNNFRVLTRPDAPPDDGLANHHTVLGYILPRTSPAYISPFSSFLACISPFSSLFACIYLFPSFHVVRWNVSCRTSYRYTLYRLPGRNLLSYTFTSRLSEDLVQRASSLLLYTVQVSRKFCRLNLDNDSSAPLCNLHIVRDLLALKYIFTLYSTSSPLFKLLPISLQNHALVVILPGTTAQSPVQQPNITSVSKRCRELPGIHLREICFPVEFGTWLNLQ